MRKGHPRGNTASAIIRFFIGLCFIAILLSVLYYLVAVRDYSLLSGDPQAPLATEEPEAVPLPFATSLAQSGTTPVPLPPQTEPDDLPAQPTPSPTPTPTPVPTPTPMPTPVPTKIPIADQSASRTSGFTVPSPATNGNVGITKCYVSVPDSYQIMQLEGWGFVEDSAFNGSECTTYVLTTNESTGKHVVFLATSFSGISGRTFSTAAQNPEDADFRVTMNVSDFADGVYNIGIVLGYKASGGKQVYAYYPLDESYSFTVLSGEIIAPVRVSPVEGN